MGDPSDLLLVFDAPAPERPPWWTGLAPFVVLGLIFYFLLYRPQAAKQAEQDKMIASLQKDDRVVMQGGLHGTVAEVGKDTIAIDVGKTRMTFDKSAVARKLDAAVASEAAK